MSFPFRDNGGGATLKKEKKIGKTLGALDQKVKNKNIFSKN